MECPKKDCRGETKVEQTCDEGESVERFRRCKRCGYRFATLEVRGALMRRILERG